MIRIKKCVGWRNFLIVNWIIINRLLWMILDLVRFDNWFEIIISNVWLKLWIVIVCMKYDVF